MDVYLKLEGVPGENSTGKYVGWSQAISVGTSVAKPLAVPPEPAGPGVCEVRVFKRIDKSSPKLMETCASGVHIPLVSLAYDQGNDRVMRVTMYDEVVSSFGVERDASPPMEAVGLTFQKIEWTNITSTGDGLTATFDTATQMGGTKPRVPFRATLTRGSGNTMTLSCPVEFGHTYRIRANTRLDGHWQTVSEFTAEIDGPLSSHSTPRVHLSSSPSKRCSSLSSDLQGLGLPRGAAPAPELMKEQSKAWIKFAALSTRPPRTAARCGRQEEEDSWKRNRALR